VGRELLGKGPPSRVTMWRCHSVIVSRRSEPYVHESTTRPNLAEGTARRPRASPRTRCTPDQTDQVCRRRRFGRSTLRPARPSTDRLTRNLLHSAAMDAIVGEVRCSSLKRTGSPD
jgi:hypothetical protein